MKVGQLPQLFDEFSNVRILDGFGLNNHLHRQVLETLLQYALDHFWAFSNVDRFQDAVVLGYGFALSVFVLVFNPCTPYSLLIKTIIYKATDK